MLDLTFLWILAGLFAGLFVVRDWADRTSRKRGERRHPRLSRPTELGRVAF
jgi:hypothetical protein